MQNFKPIAWQTPHEKFLDKYQFGDLTRDDCLEWAIWVSENYSLSNNADGLLMALIFDEEDNFLFFNQLKPILFNICQQTKLAIPQYSFCDSRYPLDITHPFYQPLVPLVTDDQLRFDYEHNVNDYFSALKQVIFQQNGLIDYPNLKGLFLDEVISLGHWEYRQGFEVAYTLCICLIARNNLAKNFRNNDLENFTLDDKLPEPFKTIANTHVNYENRMMALQR